MNVELLPFVDGQAAEVFAFCGRCGRELYSRMDVCGYCRRFFR